ncbi:TonB-dependent receptor domain-containing protein, partial [Klebsiella pneumoniae]|uniref:TonB-dependent receptor domain-containing protein n=1 Tax=Klebsiella pneumoniae TaxID=573 RepID=UPI00210A38F1
MLHGSLAEFAAEFVDSYEIGLKTSWMNDRVRLNIAAFHIDYADKQEQSLVGTTFIVNNAASADSDGFEIELFASPTDHLTIMGGIG